MLDLRENDTLEYISVQDHESSPVETLAPNKTEGWYSGLNTIMCLSKSPTLDGK